MVQAKTARSKANVDSSQKSLSGEHIDRRDQVRRVKIDNDKVGFRQTKSASCGGKANLALVDAGIQS